MTDTSRSAASNRPMPRRIESRRSGPSRRVGAIVCLSGLAAVALIGALHPMAAAGAAPSPSAALISTGAIGSVYDTSGLTGGINWIDLITKGTIVLGLLFITLRVLGRFGGGTLKRGGKMQVLESRTLAPKASLHLVAIGERRLVVGLTPSGMVSLAELDASELEEEAPALSTDGVPAAPAGIAPVPSFGAALNSLMAPVDALTGRLALLINGGRAR
jgi:flagellar biosynthetic protein FliO